MELSELCASEKLPPPSWQHLDPRLNIIITPTGSTTTATATEVVRTSTNTSESTSMSSGVRVDNVNTNSNTYTKNTYVGGSNPFSVDRDGNRGACTETNAIGEQQQGHGQGGQGQGYGQGGQEGRVMYLSFLAHYYIEQQQGEKALKVLEGVLHIFPHSQVAASQVVLSHYCLRDYEKAQIVFDQARERDPHRIEHLDAYSNILYVREKRAELSYLAHR